MARVYLSLGSNTRPYHYLPAALEVLTDTFGELQLSSVYESEAVGFAGDNFLNLVAAIETPLSVGELSACLKAIEDDHGRERDGNRYSGRTLDIDILTYDELTGVVDGVELPRDEVLTNAFVLWPLAELAGHERHPLDGRSYARLWQEYRRPQKLWRIDFHWRGQLISRADT